MVRPSYPSEYDKAVAYRAALQLIETNHPQMSHDQSETLAWSIASAINEYQVLPLLMNLSEIDNALTRAGVPESVTTSDRPDFIDLVASRLSDLDLGLLSAHEADQLHAMLSAVGIVDADDYGVVFSLAARLRMMINELLGWRLGAETAARSANVALPTERIVIDRTMVMPLADTMERVAAMSPDVPLESILEALKQSKAAHDALTYDLDDIRASLANGATNDRAFTKRVNRQFSGMQVDLERLQRAQKAYAKAAELSKRESIADSRRDRAIINRLFNQAEQLSKGTSRAMHESLADLRAAIVEAHGNDRSLMSQMDRKFNRVTIDIERLQRSVQTYAEDAKRQAQEARDWNKAQIGELRDQAEHVARRTQAEMSQRLAAVRDVIVERLGDDAVLISQLDDRLESIQAHFTQLELSVHASSQDAKSLSLQTRDEQAEVRNLIGQLADTVARLSQAIAVPSTNTARRLIQAVLDSADAQSATQNFLHPIGRKVLCPISTNLGEATKATATPRAQTAVKERVRPGVSRPASTSSSRQQTIALVALTLLVLVIIGGVAITVPLNSMIGHSLGARPQLLQEQLGEKYPALFHIFTSNIKSDTEQGQADKAFVSYDAWLKNPDDGSVGYLAFVNNRLEDSQAFRRSKDGSLDRAYGLRKDGTKVGDWKYFLGMLTIEKSHWPKAMQTASNRSLQDNIIRDISVWIRGYEPPSVRSAPPQSVFALPSSEQQYAPLTEGYITQLPGIIKPCITPFSMSFARAWLPAAIIKAHACPVHF